MRTKPLTVAAYLAIPIVFVLGSKLYFFSQGRASFDMVSVLYSALFCIAPFLLWAIISFPSDFKAKYVHAGFIACTLSLVAIVTMGLLLPRDPSGLPMQWVLYWPLSVILVLCGSGLTYAYATIMA